jgi:hypothetical protein
MECEWRFNNPNPQTQLKQLNQWSNQFLSWLSRTAPNILTLIMKKILLCFCCVSLMAGCKSTYDVTLVNGSKVTGVTKPVLDKTTGQYRFNMADGREVKVLSSRIRTIEPHGESSDLTFEKPKPKK